MRFPSLAIRASSSDSSRIRILILAIAAIGIFLILGVLSFVPWLKCPDCGGEGVHVLQEYSFSPPRKTEEAFACPRCDRSGRLSPFRRWILTPGDSSKQEVVRPLQSGMDVVSEITYQGFSRTDAREIRNLTQIRLNRPITEEIRKSGEEILVRSGFYDSVEIRISKREKPFPSMRVEFIVREKEAR